MTMSDALVGSAAECRIGAAQHTTALPGRPTFDPPFSSIPSITVSANQPFNQSPRWATFVKSTSNASFVDIFVLFGTANPTDSDFHFCAMGPR
jgi:hypothetical protein